MNILSIYCLYIEHIARGGGRRVVFVPPKIPPAESTGDPRLRRSRNTTPRTAATHTLKSERLLSPPLFQSFGGCFSFGPSRFQTFFFGCGGGGEEGERSISLVPLEFEQQPRRSRCQTSRSQPAGSSAPVSMGLSKPRFGGGVRVIVSGPMSMEYKALENGGDGVGGGVGRFTPQGGVLG